ncbi:MAG: MBL fold metallo-hydrolase [bacterium]|nr:MBL fold metallo-hydrolase [bacterium]
MRISKPSITFALLAALVLCSSGPAAELEITALGNEGFLLMKGDHVVLIDGVHRGLKGYVAPTKDEQRQRELALPPFDRVDLLLATHHHGDHFHAEAVGHHLLANADAEIVTTPNAVQRMRQQFKDFDAIADRVHGVAPRPGQRLHVTAGGLDMDVTSLHHGHRDPPVPNLGFVVDMDGSRVLHMGDTEVSVKELERFHFAADRLEVAFVPYWHLLDPEDAIAYREALGAATIVAMHLPATNAPGNYFEPADGLGSLMALLRKSAPGVVILEEPGNRYNVKVTADGD